MVFADRRDAGRQLGEQLRELRHRDNVVLGLPRGGIPVAFEVARALGAPLDVLFVRKLGVPFQPELAMGAVADGGARVLNEDVFHHLQVSAEVLADVERRERDELERQARRCRIAYPRVSLAGRGAIVVDDGIATGSTARVACEAARSLGAAHVVLAVPVAPPSAIASFCDVADEVVCLETARDLDEVGEWYLDFAPVTDAAVIELLHDAAVAATAAAAATAPAARPPASTLHR